MRASASLPLMPESFFSVRASSLRTEWRRFSAESGFWNTICTRADVVAIALAEQAGQLSPVEIDVSRRRLDDAEQRAREGGLARAGLADESKRLAGPERGADVGERVDVVPRLPERLGERVDAQHRRLRSIELARDLEPGRRLARQLLGLVVKVAAGPSAAEVVERRLLRRRRSPWRVHSDRRTRTPGSRRRAAAGTRESCRAGPRPCARPRAGCSGAGRRCRDGAGRAAPAAPGPPRRARRRTARRRGRTSRRSRRGCG